MGFFRFIADVAAATVKTVVNCAVRTVTVVVDYLNREIIKRKVAEHFDDNVAEATVRKIIKLDNVNHVSIDVLDPSDKCVGKMEFRAGSLAADIKEGIRLEILHTLIPAVVSSFNENLMLH